METIDGAVETEVALSTAESLVEQQERGRDAKSTKVNVTVSTTAPGEAGASAHTETSPLLPGGEPRDEDEDDAERQPPWPGLLEFAHRPWYRRPSIFWILVPFFVSACAFGGIITPKLNLTLELVCRKYMMEKMDNSPGSIFVPIDFNNGDNDQCRIPEVQSRVATFTLWCNLISGILSAFTSPKLGALSDRYGRKLFMTFPSIGIVLSEAITICAALYPETFPLNLLLLGYALEGLSGSFIVTMSISNAYATDCTPPSMRNVSFAWLHGCFFTGLAVGPVLAGYVVKWTGKIVIVFYIAVGVQFAFVLFMLLAVPESLSKKRQLEARARHRAFLEDYGMDWLTQLRSLNFLEPLNILWPTGPGSSRALRRNLILLSAVDTIVFGVAMGSMSVIIYYVNFQFGWKTFETASFVSVTSSSRVVALMLVLPVLTRLFKGRPDPTRPHKNSGSDNFDLYVIRFAVLLDTLGYLGYTLTKTAGPFVLSAIVASLGGIASPTLQSTLTKHIPSDRTGQLLGAIGLLHALARVVAPAVFTAIYSATVATFPQTVFLCLCITFGSAFLISWFIRPHVFFDAKAARLAEEEEEQNTNASRVAVAGTVAGFSIWSVLGIGNNP